MKYSLKSQVRKKCPNDPDYRAQLGFRLRTARCNMGWSVADAAKYFQVTERTWHNWESGVHRIPFAVYKLCRVLARLELPGDAWAGWSFQGGVLITPEGRRIEPRDSSWWSLMVRNAQSFSAAFNEASRLRMLVAGLHAQIRASAAGAAEAAGLVSSKTSGKLQQDIGSQNNVIMTSWPTHSDSQKPLMPLHAPKPTTSESALTPSFVSPWMPTCGIRLSYQRPTKGPHLASWQNQSKPVNQSPNQPNQASPGNLQASPRPNAGNSPGSSDWPEKPVSAMPAAAAAAQLASASRRLA